MNEIEELLAELPKPKRRNGSVASRKRLRKQSQNRQKPQPFTTTPKRIHNTKRPNLEVHIMITIYDPKRSDVRQRYMDGMTIYQNTRLKKLTKRQIDNLFEKGAVVKIRVDNNKREVYLVTIQPTKSERRYLEARHKYNEAVDEFRMKLVGHNSLTHKFSYSMSIEPNGDITLTAKLVERGPFPPNDDIR